MKASRAAWESPRLRRKQLPGKLLTDSQALAATVVQTPEGDPECAPLTPAFLSADRPNSALSFPTGRAPESPSKNPAAPHSQQACTSLVNKLMTVFPSLPRISYCLERMFTMAEVSTGAGGCQPRQEVIAC